MSHNTIRCFLALLGAALTIAAAPVRSQMPAWEQQSVSYTHLTLPTNREV